MINFSQGAFIVADINTGIWTLAHMTGVQKLHLLPAPGVKSAALQAAASKGQAARPEIEAVVKSPAVRARAGNRGALRNPIEERRPGDRQGPPAGGNLRNEAAAGRAERIGFSRLTALGFMVQVLGQQNQAAQTAQPHTLTQHRDAALIGSESYRRAGGEPEVLPDDATIVRVAV